MNINRHNYEEFFILYLDKELDSAGQREVELFVQQHPDLAMELDMLQQTRVVPDPSILYHGKQNLFRTAAAGDINMDNYEEWLLLYTDDELTIEQEIAVENFAIANPPVKKELDLLKKTKLQPDETVIFFDKNSLYRAEEKERRVIGIRWWRVAAAAVLVLGISITALLLWNKQPEQGSFADQGSPEIPVKQSQEIAKVPPVTPVVADTEVKKNKALSPVQNKVENKNVIASRQKLNGSKIAVKEELPGIANIEKENRNALPEPTYNPNMTEKISPTEGFAVAEKNVLTNSKEIKPRIPVTPGTFASLNNAETTPNDGEVNQPEKITKFRGLLRKITRTIEKTTNIKATDDEDRLLVGGLAIRL